MFDIGFGEMVVLAAIALIAIGPKQLPEVARTIGRLLNELKRASNDMTRTLIETRDSATQVLNEAEEKVASHLNLNDDTTHDGQHADSHTDHVHHQVESHGHEHSPMGHEHSPLAQAPVPQNDEPGDEADQMSFPIGSDGTGDGSGDDKKDS